MAMSRSLGSMSLTSVSPMKISPDVIGSRPAIMRSTVVLPHPEEPTSTANSRSWISSDSLSTAVTALNRFTRFFRITLATSDVSLLFRWRCLYRIRRKPAIDGHHHAGHESGGVGKQPYQGANQVVRLTVPTHGRVRDHLAGSGQQFARCGIDMQEAQLLGHEEPGRQRIHADAGMGKMDRQPPREIAHRRFRSRIGGHLGQRREGAHRRDVDYGSPAPCDHAARKG